MWLSDVRKEKESAVRCRDLSKMIRANFNFDAPTSSDPFYARASDVLLMLGLPSGKGAATFAGTVLKKMVGPSVLERRNGVVGRWYAMPPLRQQDEKKDLLA